MPDASNSPVPLQELWDFRQKYTSGTNIIDSFSKHKILPGAIAAEKLKAFGDPKPYSDPLLRQPRKYASFLKELHSGSMIGYSPSNDCLEYVDMFFVLRTVDLD